VTNAGQMVAQCHRQFGFFEAVPHNLLILLQYNDSVVCHQRFHILHAEYLVLCNRRRNGFVDVR
jgi:hypothetical protein